MIFSDGSNFMENIESRILGMTLTFRVNFEIRCTKITPRKIHLNLIVKLKMLSHGHYKVVKPGRKYYVYNTTNTEALKARLEFSSSTFHVII